MASERQISVGGVKIGGGAPVVVQSMTLTKTHDVEATTAQIAALASAGCEVVRVAVPKTEDAEALPKIVRFSPLPVIADIHFHASLALKAIESGVAAVRINPGNIGGPDKVELVVRAARAAGIPMRIGANSGSLPKHLSGLAQQDQAEALVEAALEEVRLLEKLDFHDFKISVKSSHVPTMIRAYRMLSEKVPYPLRLGVTEAGTPFAGSIKSAVGMGALLVDGIGDTMRVSLTADPVEEVKTAFEILKSLGLRERGPIMIACPSCGRDNVGVQTLAEKVELRLAEYPQHFEVAVLGCAVNGPGEAGDADFGIAGGRDVGFVYAHGRTLKKVSSDILVEELIREEMNAVGGQEMLMPVLTPAELWETTGRIAIPEVFHLQDRAGRRFILPMTHEETVTFHARELQSYKQLPQLWYHFSVKDRDEPRPRGGLLRVREFIMKDAYSFDRHEDGVRKSFEKNREAYKRIFARCELETYDVQAESGIMGGKYSVDFLAPSGSGENTLVLCENGDYAADIEVARAVPRGPTFPERLDAPAEVETPGVTTIEGLAQFLGIDEAATSKAMPVVKDDGTLVLALVRGDDRLSETKLYDALLGASRPATDDEIRAAFGAGGGSLGPIGFEGE